MESVAAIIDKNEADALYIVGGDGTLARALTGIFKSADHTKVPIGIFPGGSENHGLLNLVPAVFCKFNWSYESSRILVNHDDIRPMCESAMSLIEEKKIVVRPFKIEIVGFLKGLWKIFMNFKIL